MWRVRHLFVLAAALGVGLVLSACGGDSSPETPIVVPTETTQGSLSKAEFIAQADSACAEANSSIEQFAASGQGESEAAQIAQLRQGVIDQIKQLNPPSDPTLDQFLKAMSDQVSAGQKIGLAVQRGEDPSQFETELDSAKSDAESAASAYGFKECGKAISASSSGTSSSSPSPSSSSSSGGTVTPSAPSTGAPSTGAPSGGTGGGTPGSSGTSGTSGSSGSGGSGGIGPG
ncbi:MAG: hypothetical protein ACM33U_04635 [Solirubrobacterales bacterium]